MRVLKVIEKATKEVVETIDVTDDSDRDVAAIKSGMRQQMNNEEYSLVEETS